ncbi:alpha/beta-hydrolase [Ceratobasidium sp. AG-I]|nr:alpha/beta-hydrolase [Ceratobasidium sp. AG-I]
MKFLSLALGFAFSLQALAAPTPVPLEERDSTITPLSASAISAYAPYSNFAAAAYCGVTTAWSCSKSACKRIPGFVPYATGGDGNAVPLWYVGWWPSASSVVVAHEGTDPTQFLSLLTDASALFGTVNPTLFPGLPSTISVHSGFRDAHAASAVAVLTTVKKILAEKGATKVSVAGHSLGGALALLDAVYLRANLPSTIAIKTVTFGQPRVGNQAFADWVDQKLTDYSRITNIEDVIPIVPGRGLGYHHSNGEKHIKTTGVWNACAGQDNTSEDCIIGMVPTIFQGNLIDHLGPYEGVWIGTLSC